jgi:hypothetical protein
MVGDDGKAIRGFQKYNVSGGGFELTISDER